MQTPSELPISAPRPLILLVIDDEPIIHHFFRTALAPAAVSIRSAYTAAEGVEQFAREGADAVFIDVGLPDGSGLDAFRRLQKIDAAVLTVIITGSGTPSMAMEAMANGAAEYLAKPLDLEGLRRLVSRVRTTVRAHGTVPPDSDESGGFVGQSAPMLEVYKAIGRVAQLNATVLVTGESGTGKELVAHEIHRHSGRTDKPFVAVNCAAIPETLLESELFGHEKGAFSGADRKRIGRFEQADGGTLFLDEIGDMSPLTQAKVLRVLQEQAFERVGGGDAVRTDVRVVAATHRDLRAMVASGKFREDLYYRLTVLTVELPPLRGRGDDLRLLAEHFIRRFSRQMGVCPKTIAVETLDVLGHYQWPGNVRELQSALRQAILVGFGPVLRPDSLSPHVRGESQNPLREQVVGPVAGSPLPELNRYVRSRLDAGGTGLHAEVTALMERALLTEVLHHTGGNRTRAARILGVSQPTLRTRLAAADAYKAEGRSDVGRISPDVAG